MKANTKGKTVVPSKKASARKPGRRNNHTSRASTENKEKPAGKPSVKSPEKEKKSALSKKTAKKPLKAEKKLPAAPPPAAKKASVKKAPARSPKIDAEAIKKKAAPPKTKTPRITAAKIALPKASQTPRKSSPKTKGKIPEKIKVKKTAGTKKIGDRSVKPATSRQRGKVSSRAKGPEKKSTSRIKAKNEFNATTRTQLPDEYGENELILMAVDPDVVFVDWEIKKEEAPEGKDGFTMRVFDVAGGESPRLRRESFYDIKIEGRVGSGFFELGMPGREVAVEIGFFDKSNFLPVLSSRVVSMPRLLVSDELGIAKKLFESGIPIGY
jgi:hypothetical protein